MIIEGEEEEESADETVNVPIATARPMEVRGLTDWTARTK